jgi:hypothetical protein
MPAVPAQRWMLGLALGVATVGASQAAIYSCVMPDGRRLTSDLPIRECNTREQQVHGRDGLVREVRPPALSPEEAAALELKKRDEAAARAARADAARFDRNLLARYPNVAAHDKARSVALDDLSRAQQVSESRLVELAKERKALDQEAEFYVGKSLPPKLRRLVDANDAARGAQEAAIANQGLEKARVNRRYDVELVRLKKLWAGAAAGSLGPPPHPSEWELPAGAPAAPGPKSPPPRQP